MENQSHDGADWQQIRHTMADFVEAVTARHRPCGELSRKKGFRHSEDALPMRASEDFGLFGITAKSAMFFLGAGETVPALHNPDYDFPDV